MFIRKKEFIALKERVEKLEQSENLVNTAEYGRRSTKWYIRMLCSNIKIAPR